MTRLCPNPSRQFSLVILHGPSGCHLVEGTELLEQLGSREKLTSTNRRSCTLASLTHPSEQYLSSGQSWHSGDLC